MQSYAPSCRVCRYSPQTFCLKVMLHLRFLFVKVNWTIWERKQCLQLTLGVSLGGGLLGMNATWNSLFFIVSVTQQQSYSVDLFSFFSLHGAICGDWTSLFQRPVYGLSTKHTELGEKVEYLRLGWWRCKAEFLVRPESRQLLVQLYSKLRVGWKLRWGATFEQRLDNNVIASHKTLTAGWNFQYGWPWAGSLCPGWKGSTHPRKSTGSQRRHGLEVGTKYWPHGCKGTSSGSWRHRRWKRGWQTERKNLRAQCDDQRVLVLKWECSWLMGSIFLTQKPNLIWVEMVVSLAHYKYEDYWFGNLSSLKSGKW